MHKKRPWLAFVIGCATAGAATVASAAGMGAGNSGAVMGQTLDFSAQVRLAPGETLTPDCVGAQVTMGDRQLPASEVRTVVRMQDAELAEIRVITSHAVDEPVVGVLLSAGCTARLTRRFVVLADPPTSPTPPAVPAYAAAPPLVTPAAEEGAVRVAPLTAAGAGARAPTNRATASTQVVMAPPAAGPALGHGAVPRTAARPTHRATQRAAHRPAAAGAAVQKVSASTGGHASGARLELDAADPPPDAAAAAVEQALEAVAVAASATRAAAASASASAERIAALERRVSELQAEAKRSGSLGVQLRQRLLRAEDASRWTWPLLVVTMLLTALSGWLGWRLAALQQARQDDWQRAAAALRPGAPEPGASKQATAPIPFVTSEIRVPQAAGALRRSPPAWPPAAGTDLTQPETVAFEPRSRHPTPSPAAVPSVLPAVAGTPDAATQVESAMQRTAVLPADATDTAPRDVSIEELIDLEQQADFFVVLGQDEAATDLLVEHLRNTGGGSPLPYLKLLEIYGRRGDRSAYERMRSRFNHRFNAYAPEWGVDLQAGRTLEDYPGVIPRLEQVWSRPLDAMAELEALLFRKSRGDLFDLPAYREVLFLYAMARDLLDREAGGSGNVDLLLPLTGDGAFGNTAPAPYLELGPEAGSERSTRDDRTTGPVDLDLTAGIDRQTSIFDAMEDTPPLPRQR